MSLVVENAVLKCRDVAELVTDYAEGALPLRRSLAVRLHLLICRMCRSYLDQMTKTQNLLRASRLDAPAIEVEARILAAREREIRP